MVWTGLCRGATCMKQAVEADSKRFAPFRLDRYEPLKILGAGGFGVAFLCLDRILNSKVVIKVLRPDTDGAVCADNGTSKASQSAAT